MGIVRDHQASFSQWCSSTSGAVSPQTKVRQPPPKVNDLKARKQELHFAKPLGLFHMDLIAFCFPFVQK